MYRIYHTVRLSITTNQLTASFSAFHYGAKAVVISSTACVKGTLAQTSCRIEVEGFLALVAMTMVDAQATNICCVRGEIAVSSQFMQKHLRIF